MAQDEKTEGGAEATEATPEAPATEEVVAEKAPLSAELQAVVDFCEGEIATIKARETKSNYHNARASAFKQVRDLIDPPAPKKTKAQEKAEKAAEKKKEKEAAAANAPAPAPANNATPEVEGETSVEPIEEGA